MLARNWNDGDPANGYVSDQWSGQQCTITRVQSLDSSPSQAPAPPVNSKAQFGSGGGQQQVLVSWDTARFEGDVRIGDGADSYRVQRQDSGSWVDASPMLPFTGQFALSFTDMPPANPNHVYFYRVCGQNSTGTTCAGPVKVGKALGQNLPLVSQLTESRRPSARRRPPYRCHGRRIP